MSTVSRPTEGAERIHAGHFEPIRYLKHEHEHERSYQRGGRFFMLHTLQVHVETAKRTESGRTVWYSYVVEQWNGRSIKRVVKLFRGLTEAWVRLRAVEYMDRNYKESQIKSDELK